MNEAETSRERAAAKIAQHAVAGAREGRQTVTIRGWVHPDSSVWWSSGAPNHPSPLRATTREQAHDDLDLILDMIERERA